jgi:secreted trypsin-like serine protease
MAPASRREVGSPCGRLFHALSLLLFCSLVLVGCSSAANAPVPFHQELTNTPDGSRVALINHSSLDDDYYNGHFCGAVLVEADVLATASHCVEGKDPQIIDAVIGATHLCRGGEITGERIRVSSIVIPPAPLQELALLRLEQASGVEPIPIAGNRPTSGTSVGWGRQSDGGVSPCDPKRTQQMTIGSSACDSYAGALELDRVDGLNYLCAIPAPSSTHNTCQGDSGGPLIARVQGVVAVYALTLGGSSCQIDSPGIYIAAEAILHALGGLSSSNTLP